MTDRSSDGAHGITPAGDVQIDRADPTRRRQVLLLVTLVIALTAAGIYWLQDRVDQMQRMSEASPRQAAEAMMTLSTGFFDALALGGIVAGLYFAYLAVRTLRGRRFPPAGSRVIRDTKVLTGGAARRHGMATLVVAILVILGSLYVRAQAHDKIESVLASALRAPR